MYILMALLVAAVGLFQLIAPNLWYELTQSWKSYSAADPSDLFIKVTRIRGGVFALIGLVCLILLLIL